MMLARRCILTSAEFLSIGGSRCCSNSTNKSFLFTLSSLTNKRREYEKKELIGYSMEQMYDVVSDVSKYHTFVPYCKKSKVYNKRSNTANADIVVGFPPINEAYTCNLTFDVPNSVKSECFDGRLFNYLLNHWRFSPGLKDIRDSCVIDFLVTFEFKSALHSQISNIFFELIIDQMEHAFLDEAKRRYGAPSINSHILFAKRK